MSRIWSGNNRAPWHDYTARCIYHITLMKHPDAPSFGYLSGDYRLPPGIPGCSHIVASEAGRAIKQVLREFNKIHPALRLYQYALMPDHLHLIISVEEKLEEAIGRKLATFKGKVNNLAGNKQLFDKGYNDQILIRNRSLDVIYRYLKANPYRLALRRANPDFFKRTCEMVIGNNPCQLYGNHHLLDNPFKEQVIVHRADTETDYSRNRERWLHIALNGGVLVSPFISPREKAIKNEAAETGCRVILVTNRPFFEREKPCGTDFDLCAQGRLLIISPTTPLSRAHCLQMNSLAKTIANCTP